MKKQKLKIIIIDGARGVGKTTFIQLLKNKVKSCMVHQLSGIEKVENEYELIKKHYDILTDFYLNSLDIPYTLICDRNFMSQAVYCSKELGYKDFSFDKEFDEYLDKLKDVEIIFVHLKTVPSLFEERLKRDKVEFQDLKYDANASIKEQDVFEKYFKKIADKGNVNHKVIECDNSYVTVEESVKSLIYTIELINRYRRLK